MVQTLDDTKRMAIAMELADMKTVQNLLIANDQKLISTVSDEEIRKRFPNARKKDAC